MMGIELVDHHLDYNRLLGCSWSYAMTSIVSLVFPLILFSLYGRIVIVDQFSFCTLDYSPLPSGTIPLVGGIPDSNVNVGTIFWRFLPWWIFSSPSTWGSTDGFYGLHHSSWPNRSLNPLDPFKHWLLWRKNSIITSWLAYQDIQSALYSSITLVMTNGAISPPWTVRSNDLLDEVLPTNEAIW